jgi:putative endonuclease
MMASEKNGTLYIVVTNDLRRRVFEHKSGKYAGFTQKYDVKMLVFFEPHSDIRYAITMEKRMKKRNREWKIQLIEKFNPEWNDLSCDI